MTHCFRWLLSVTLVALAVLLIAPSTTSAQPLQCKPIAGSLTSRFVIDKEGPAWAGDVYLSINGGVPLHATVRDTNDVPMTPLNPADPATGDTWGEETLTFKLDNGESFQLKGYFVTFNSEAPYAVDFHETGRIVAGSGNGMFARATGSMVIDGQVVLGGGMAAFQWDVYPWVWMARIRGSVCLFPGAQKQSVQP